MFNKTISILSAFALMLTLGFMSCQKENVTVASSTTEALMSQKTEMVSNNATLVEASSIEKTLAPDFVIKVVGTTQPVTQYLSTPGQPTRTITSENINGQHYFKFCFVGTNFNNISKNITYTLSPVPVNWPGHQIKFTFSNAYNPANCWLNGNARLWYLTGVSGNQVFLYAYPTISGASIQFF